MTDDKKITGELFEVSLTPENYIYVSVWGTWNVAEAEKWSAAIQTKIDDVHAQGYKAYLLYNASSLNMLHFATSDVLKKLVESFTMLDYDYLAVFHKNLTVFRSVFNLLSKLYPALGPRTSFFSNEAAAKRYLDKLDIKK